MKKKLLALALALTLALSLAACGDSGTSSGTGSASSGAASSGAASSEAAASGSEAASSSAASSEAASSGETTVLKIAASPTPHAEILEKAKEILAEQGIDLEITEYGDYVVPNTAVEEGDEDANYFQHYPYLEQFNEENGTHIVSAGAVHYEPMGIYAGISTSLDDLPDGAVIAVPNDATNEARALQLLAAQGLIELDESVGLKATPNDITSNPKNLEFQELEAAMLPNTIEEVNLSVINSNYALQAGLNPAEDALASEDASSDAAQTYANIVAVKEGNENDPAILALMDVLHSQEIQDFINETYSGSVLPIS